MLARLSIHGTCTAFCLTEFNPFVETPYNYVRNDPP